MAQGEYELRIHNASGIEQYRISDFETLEYIKEVNAPGLLRFTVPDDHQTVGDLDRDWQVDLRRRRLADPGADNAIAWYSDFTALVRDEERSADNDGQTRVTFFCPGDLHLLSRAIVAYPAETADRTAFTADAAETIAKTLVQYNATSSGTTGDGRVRNVDLSGITIESDAASGTVLDWNCAWCSLLDELQKLSAVGAGDFDLVKTGATAWQFRWYDGQLGTDRSASVTFALQYGNMASPSLRRDRLAEATVAIVAGQGEQDNRIVQVRTGANYAASGNSIERFVDARDLLTTSSLQDRGDARLDEWQAKDLLDFNVIQTPGSLYGLHYFLGDLVTGYYQGITATKQISRVHVQLGPDGEERIQIGLKDA